MVVLRSKKEIGGLRRAGDLVARALVLVGAHVRAGVRLSEIDRIVEEFIRSEDVFEGPLQSASAESC